MKRSPICTLFILSIFISLFTKIIVFASSSGSSEQELNPKISVIVSVYNAEAYLKECLNSVVNQTLDYIQIICVNDASPDNSL